MTDRAPTVRDTIAAALDAVLSPLVAPGGYEADPDGDPSVFPALALFDHGDRLLEREAGLERRAADFTVEGYVERAGGADARADRNALHAQAVAAIMADDTLGNLVELIDMDDLRKLVATLSERGRMAFAQSFTVQFVTRRTDPALPA